MAFTDEQIQQAKRANQTQTQNIQENVLIHEQEYHFQREPLFDGKATILLPKEFVNMPLSLAKQKYPMEQRPEIIKTSMDTSVNFAFSLLPQQIEPDQIREAVKQFFAVVKRMQPANRFFDIKLEVMEKVTIGWFDFRSPGLDEPLYTMMAFTALEQKLFYGVFNSAFRLMEDWKPIAVQVFCSLETETVKNH